MAALLLVLLLVAVTGCASDRGTVALSPAAADLVRTAPGAVAVHYEEHVSGAREYISVSAPTARIKRVFVEAVSAPGRLGPVRDVPTARFAYPDIEAGLTSHWMYPPRVDLLRRTFQTGLVLDFYSPSGYTSNTEIRLKVLGRLVRLDDGAVLWAQTCVFDARVDRIKVFVSEPSVEHVLTDVGLAAADRCARDLAESFLAGMSR
jgi:hypothetical protein